MSLSLFNNLQIENSDKSENSDNTPLIISLYLLKHCKLWVWDFDDTLIDTKYYYKTSMDPDKIRNRTDIELTNEIPQWRYFKRLVEYLVKNGKYVAIASFGTYEIIKAYMDRIFGFNQHYFMTKNLIASTYNERKFRGYCQPPNKNEYIYKIMKTYKIDDFKRVVLFDDLPSNIGDAIGVGIIGIQIATPNNGDKQGDGGNGDIHGSGGVSYSGGNMFFGPWVMLNFDKKIENDCGKELYLNRKFTGIANQYSNNKNNNNNKLNSITKRSYSGMSYDNTDFRNGVKESFSQVAFGSGIGDRKISVNPEYRWNKMNIANPPKWVNGNWENNTNLNNDTDTLGGKSSSFWDVHHIFNSNSNNNNLDNDDKYIYENIKIIKNDNTNDIINKPSNKVMGISEGFENINKKSDGNNSNTSNASNVNNASNAKDNSVINDVCNSCKDFEWNWIVCILILIIVLMCLLVWYTSENLKI